MRCDVRTGSVRHITGSVDRAPVGLRRAIGDDKVVCAGAHFPLVRLAVGRFVYIRYKSCDSSVDPILDTRAIREVNGNVRRISS